MTSLPYKPDYTI